MNILSPNTQITPTILFSISPIHSQDSPTPQWDKSKKTERKGQQLLLHSQRHHRGCSTSIMQLVMPSTSSSYTPPTLMVRPMPFFFFIMGHGSWLLKFFSIWRQSLIFFRGFFRFRSQLLFICYDFEVKKWFLLITRKVQSSQLKILDRVNRD